MRRARRLTLECLQVVRRSVAAMRAATLEELAIEPSIRRLVGEFAGSTGLSVQLEVELAQKVSPSPEVAHALYRAVQEGLTNVHKHPQASEVLRFVLHRIRGYFSSNANRMRYPSLREQHLPIGSGAVGPSAKHLVQHRMKRTGSRWSELGARAILDLRCHLLSGRSLDHVDLLRTKID